MLAWGFEDDTYAPPDAVDAMIRLYSSSASVTTRKVSRGEARVGHFGFFRERHRGFWHEAKRFLDEHADVRGKVPGLT